MGFKKWTVLHVKSSASSWFGLEVLWCSYRAQLGTICRQEMTSLSNQPCIHLSMVIPQSMGKISTTSESCTVNRHTTWCTRYGDQCHHVANVAQEMTLLALLFIMVKTVSICTLHNHTISKRQSKIKAAFRLMTVKQTNCYRDAWQSHIPPCSSNFCEMTSRLSYLDVDWSQIQQICSLQPAN